jgi:MFS family permease
MVRLTAENRRWWILATMTGALFRNRNFSADNAVLGLVQFVLTGLTVFGAIYVQELLGFGPIAAGVSLLPVMVPLLLLAPVAGRLYDRIGPRGLVAAGAALLCAGLMWTATLLARLEYVWLLPGYVIIGAGIALVMTPASTDAMNTAPAALRGQAQGVVQTLRQAGGTVGLAVMGTAVAGVERSHGSLVSGISSALYIGGGAVFAGAVVAWALLRYQPAADAPATRGPAAAAGASPAAVRSTPSGATVN